MSRAFVRTQTDKADRVPTSRAHLASGLHGGFPPDGPARDDVVVALRERGVQSKPYLPAIHLMSYYREVHGYREGQFPVCEDVAARSLALPFFPELREDQVERVASTLGTVLGGS